MKRSRDPGAAADESVPCITMCNWLFSNVDWMKTDLKELSLAALEEFVGSMDEPRYRAKQVFAWMYRHHAHTFDEMSNLPEKLRRRLSERATIGKLAVAAQQHSLRDGTTKFLFGLSDGLRIESVLIPPRRSSADAGKRLTLCVSTQVGCPLDCRFCATGTMGFARNLTSGEIVEQVLAAQSLASAPVTNLVFMGMGEPMLNYDNVMAAIDIITNHAGAGISPRRITVSTAGYAEQIRRMADEGRKVKLALSLHSLDSATRTILMPITKKHAVEELLDALEYYARKARRSVMLEYILFEGLNDSDADLKKLITAARRLECRVNLIPFHSIDFTRPSGFVAGLRGAPPQRILRFSQRLREAGVPVFIRDSAGEDIDAACGQLAVRSQQTVPQPNDHHA